MSEEYLKEVVVLIPSLDPDEKMVEYVRGLKKRGFEKIIVVDDGSGRETQPYFEAVKQLQGVVVLRHAVNQGKGRALKTGFHYFLNTYKQGEMVGVVTADADGQHSVEDTARVASRLKASGGVVLGTRNFKASNVPFKSRSGNQITTAVFALFYGKRISDTQTGLRGLPYSFIYSCLQFAGERFDYEIAMLIEAVRAKVPIIEESIETIYIDSNRATHFHALKDSIRIYKVILRMFFQFAISGVLAFIVDIGIFDFLTKTVLASLNVSVAVFGGTLFARVVSSLINYQLNRKVVFRNKKSAGKSFVRYYCLCIMQLLCSWILVVLVFRQLSWDTTLIKTIVDLCLFFISYQIQRFWVFREETA